MNAPWSYRQPYLALISDEPEAAQRLTMMLLAHGAPSVCRWERGEQALVELASGGVLPDLLVIDLREPPEATAALLKSIRSTPCAEMVTIAAMVPARERQLQEMQFAAGADAVFERLAENTDYRREAARLVSYWVRSQRLDAVGA